MPKRISNTTRIALPTVLICLAIGFGWSDILNLVGNTYSFKCHDVWRRWVGKDATQIARELGPPAAKHPSDQSIQSGAAKGVLYQRWTYKKPELWFEVRLADNIVTEAYGDFKFQISEYVHATSIDNYRSRVPDDE